MLTHIGDRVLTEADCAADVPRSGTVTAVRGSLVTVRWDDGVESTFAPLAGSLWSREQWEEWRNATR